MPGYYVHLAATNPKARQNRSFVLGVESPDLLKMYYSLYGLEGAREKYNQLKLRDMPDFSCFESRLQQKELKGSKDGLHYGLSSDPDLFAFWNHLTPQQKNNPFYIGYLWHLLTDLLMYKCLDIDSKFDKIIENYSGNDRLEFIKRESDRLHEDWDKTNGLIAKEYPDVQLTSEILELGIIKFINSNELNYIDYDVIKYLIDYLRIYDLTGNHIDDILINIMKSLPIIVKKTEEYSFIKKKV